MVLGCMDRVWIKLDTDEWFKTSDRCAYQVDEVHMLVERYGPDEGDKKRYWPGFVVDLDDLSTRTVLVDFKGQLHDPEPIPPRESALTSSAQALCASTGGSESPSSCSPRSAKSATGRSYSDSSVAVVTDPDARDADHEDHLSVEPAKADPSRAAAAPDECQQ